MLFRERCVWWCQAGLLLVLLAGCASTGPAPVEDRSGRAPRSAAAAARATVPVPGGATHRVVRGDTLYGIAFRNGLDYRDLARWNGIAAPYTIRVGEQLRLSDPSRHAATAAPPRPVPPPPAARPAPAVPTAAVTAPSPPPPSSPPPRPASPPAVVSTPAAAPPPSSTPAPAPVSAAPAGAVAWRWPLSGSVLAGYVAGDPARSGVDIAGKAGGQVVAAADGEVVYSGNGLVGYGELVIIKHSPSLLSAYARNGRRLVEERAQVKAGQPIAELASSRPVLHFEIRRNGKPINPLEYLPSR